MWFRVRAVLDQITRFVRFCFLPGMWSHGQVLTEVVARCQQLSLVVETWIRPSSQKNALACLVVV
jgi:hypothetical protein